MKKGNQHGAYYGYIGLQTRSGLDFQGPISEGKISRVIMNHKNNFIVNYQGILAIVSAAACLVVAQFISGTLPLIALMLRVVSFCSILILYIKARQALHKEQSKQAGDPEAEANVSHNVENLLKVLSRTTRINSISLKSTGNLSEGDEIILDKVLKATSEDRLELYLQPIVGLPKRKVCFYEAFSRMRDEDGAMLKPADYIDAVERANRIGFIDNMILFRSVQAVRALRQRESGVAVFCNISPATLYDQNFFSLFTQYLDASEDLSSQLIFEFTYPAITLVDPTIGKSLEAIAERGFVFSVDHIQRLDIDFSSLKRLNVKYVKMPSQMLVNMYNDEQNGKERFQRFADELAASDIQLIAEKVEYENCLEKIEGAGVRYAQGNLFGYPRPATVYVSPPPLREVS